LSNPHEAARHGGYRQYLLGVLLAILAFNYVDRLALGLLLQDIKIDLRLSDTELGLLSGIAFALFYSVMGLPIARWADRGNRVLIISLTTALWSVMVALCGAATSFAQLLLIRVGVGIGEAGCIPPAHSLIADHFTRAERPRAIARYMLGGPLSSVIGYFVAGWLNQLIGWQWTFVLLGAPGLAMAALAWFTLKEPRIHQPTGAAHIDLASRHAEIAPASAPQPTLMQVGRVLSRNRTFCHLLIALSILAFFSFGTAGWQPAFFIRSFKVPSATLGLWLSIVYGIGGMLGIYLGGEWASHRAAGNERRQLGLTALAQGGFGLLAALTYLSPNQYLSLGLLGVGSVAAAMSTAPLFATIQTLVPPSMRAMSIAIIFMFSNLIGLGLGPLAVGALSDVLRPWAGEESLRYALLSLCPGFLWVAWHLWRASLSVTRDLNEMTGLERLAGELRRFVSS
jgi:MFS family permease